jgi:mannan endo-1,6-alpha-mannosidase
MTWSTFYPAKYGGNIISEITCDPWAKCDRDQLCFKGLMASWFSTIILVAPYTSGEVLPKLIGSAIGAGLSCTGKSDNQCGQQWFAGKWDGTEGIEQEMSALSVFANSLVAFAYQGTAGPVDADNGGNSTSNPDGGSKSGEYKPPVLKNITGGDRAGAAIVTLLFAGAWIAIVLWLLRAK